MTRLLPGGDAHALLLSMLNFAATFLHSLQAEVPILLRPYHEMNQGHFWWGAVSCSASEFIALWRFTARHLRVVHGLTNVLMVYAPSATADATATSYLAYFPGDDVVDVLGLDVYEKPLDKSYNVTWSESLLANVRIVATVAAARAKPWAVSETGPLHGLHPRHELKKSHWWTERLLQPLQTFYATEGAALPSPAYVMGALATSEYR